MGDAAPVPLPSGGITVPPATEPPSPGTPRRRLRWLVALVVVALGLGDGSATLATSPQGVVTSIEAVLDEAPTLATETAAPRRRARIRPAFRRLVRPLVAAFRRPRFVTVPAQRSALAIGPPRWRGPPLAVA